MPKSLWKGIVTALAVGYITATTGILWVSASKHDVFEVKLTQAAEEYKGLDAEVKLLAANQVALRTEYATLGAVLHSIEKSVGSLNTTATNLMIVTTELQTIHKQPLTKVEPRH